jgi:MYXO-CTERM domain-containing protein
VQGDATLDGTVNFDDLLLLAKSYNATGPAVTWGGGDFDYSGTVNFDDLLVLAKNYNAVLPGGAAIPGATAAFDADVAAAFAQAAVPEPSGMMFVGAIGAAMAAGRRRRQRAPQGPPRLPV